MVGLQQALRVRHAALLVEADAVDDVAAIGGQGHAVLRFVAGGARLGELAGHAPDLHYRAAGGEGHYHRHLQQYLEGIADLRRGKFGEAFRAIPALEQEGASGGDFGELPAQLASLAGEDQRRVSGEGLLDLARCAASGYSGCCWIGLALQLSGLQDWLIYDSWQCSGKRIAAW